MREINRPLELGGNVHLDGCHTSFETKVLKFGNANLGPSAYILIKEHKLYN